MFLCGEEHYCNLLLISKPGMILKPALLVLALTLCLSLCAHPEAKL